MYIKLVVPSDASVSCVGDVVGNYEAADAKNCNEKSVKIFHIWQAERIKGLYLRKILPA